jgi:hypothetical protein
MKAKRLKSMAVSKHPMTLIEVMIAISLLILATSLIGWKVHGMIAKKRFTSAVERIRSRLMTCRQIAFNMQCDWRADIECGGKKGFCRVSCIEDPEILDLPSIAFDSIEFMWEGEKMDKISFNFTASGEVFPHGHLQIRSEHVGVVDWTLPDFFSLCVGKTSGPFHPTEYSEQGGKL